MRFPFFPFSASAASLLLASAAPGQVHGGGTIHHSLDPWTGVTRGVPVSPVGDHDGDGIPDFIASNTLGDKVLVLSGATGSTLLQIDGTSGSNFGAFPSLLGDVNGDGVQDYLVAAPSVNHAGLQHVGAVYVCSGTDGTAIHTIYGDLEYETFARSLVPAGDLNGDGVHDFLIGQAAFEISIFRYGRIWAYDGATGNVLYHVTGTQSGAGLGEYLTMIGDVDGDGVLDFATGLQDYSGAFQFEGAVEVYSGVDGAFLYSITGGMEFAGIGGNLTSLGDLNGDGKSEFFNREFLFPWVASVRSGADGSVMFQYDQSAFEEYKRTQAIYASAAGDVNGDGVPDFFLGDYSADFNDTSLRNAGALSVHSGVDGVRIAAFEGTERDQNLGRYVAPLGDIDGDGKDEMIFSGDSIPIAVVGLDSFLSSDDMTISLATGGPVDLEIDFPDAAASLNYRVLFTINGMNGPTYGVPIPLGFHPMLVDSWNGIYPFAVHTGMGGILSASGDASADLLVPPLPGGLDGISFWLAAVAYPTGMLPSYSTGAFEVRFTP